MTILEENISSKEIWRHEEIYNRLQTTKSKFEYSLCLLKSTLKSDMLKAEKLLNELREEDKGSGSHERDYIFYLAVVNARLKEFDIALRYVRNLLQAEPTNSQAYTLSLAIRKKKLQHIISEVVTMTIFSFIFGNAIYVFYSLHV